MVAKEARNFRSPNRGRNRQGIGNYPLSVLGPFLAPLVPEAASTGLPGDYPIPVNSLPIPYHSHL